MAHEKMLHNYADGFPEVKPMSVEERADSEKKKWENLVDDLENEPGHYDYTHAIHALSTMPSMRKEIGQYLLDHHEELEYGDYQNILSKINDENVANQFVDLYVAKTESNVDQLEKMSWFISNCPEAKERLQGIVEKLKQAN